MGQAYELRGEEQGSMGNFGFLLPHFFNSWLSYFSLEKYLIVLFQLSILDRIACLDKRGKSEIS